jgi:plastin-1
MWLNSLGVDPYVNHLYDDLEDGIIILQMLDAIKPGIVSWSKVNRKPPLNKYKKVENCNYAVTLGKQLKFSLVGIAGQDIQEKNKKLMLALIWQAMRFYVMNFIKTQFQGKDIGEDDIVRWANQMVSGAGKSSGPISDFKDKKIATGVFLIDLLGACQPESVDSKLITPGQSEDDARLNAQYAISCARKMGCTVFCLWEDIVEVKPKMILTFIGAVMARYGK